MSEEAARTSLEDSGNRLSRSSVALRSGLFNLTYYLHTVAMLLFVAPICFFLPQRICLAVTHGWARRSLWLLRVICRIRVEYRGIENLPDSPFVLAHKHQSELETFALVTALDKPCFVVKRELLFVPIWGFWALKSGMIFVFRGAGSAAVRQITDGARRAIMKGRPVVLAPQGKRVRPGAEQPYKYGIVHLYQTLQVPVVPMALNSGLFWPRGRFLRYPGTVVMSFRPPIAPGLSPEEFETQLIDAIETESDALLLDADRSRHRPPFRREADVRLRALKDLAESDSSPPH